MSTMCGVQTETTKRRRNVIHKGDFRGSATRMGHNSFFFLFHCSTRVSYMRRRVYSTARMYINTPHTIKLMIALQQHILHMMSQNTLLGTQRNKTVHGVDRAMTCNVQNKSPPPLILILTRQNGSHWVRNKWAFGTA